MIELVIVLVIIGIIAAIAVGRFSRASQAANESCGDYSLRTLQDAIDRYHADHGRYPGKLNIATQLTKYSDEAGYTSTASSTRYRFGPYLRAIPAANGGSNPGSAIIGGRSTYSAGWLYSEITGKIVLNSPPEGGPQEDD